MGPPPLPLSLPPFLSPFLSPSTPSFLAVEKKPGTEQRIQETLESGIRKSETSLSITGQQTRHVALKIG